MTEHRPTERANATVEPQRPAALSVRLLLLLVALVPTIGMVALAATAAARAASERDAANRLHSDVTHLLTIIDARVAAADEEVASSVLTIGADLGVDAAGLQELYGVDYAAQLDAARAVVDADPVLASAPEVAESVTAVRALRPGIDAGTVSFEDLHAAAHQLNRDLDELWAESFERRVLDETSGTLPTSVHARLDALDHTYLALTAGSTRATSTGRLLIGPATIGDVATVLDAGTRFDTAVEGFEGRLGPRARVAWDAHRSNAAARRFTATLDDAVVVALTGQPSPLSSDPVAFGEAFIDGTTWGEGLRDTVRGAAADLRAIGTDEAADATSDLRLLQASGGLLVLLSLGGAVLVARLVARPIRRLEGAAQEIRAGRFDLPPIDVRGPRELADTASAFNEMTSTLSAVEAHAVALADDPEASLLSEELPGRTGRALQVALNRLRSSMRVAEQHRRELEEAATHDALTGLLNRPAAMEVIARDLPRVAREGGAVAALFIDLDNLKEINDAHRHAAGDDALRLTAEALRAGTRATDVVARLGGDEFLVAGVVHDLPEEVTALARRIHAAVSERSLATATEQVPLRCSIGIAIAEPSDTVQSLIDKADAALYTAKARGRHQIAWHEPERSTGP